eukprot:494384-Amphidinium_carterae.1
MESTHCLAMPMQGSFLWYARANCTVPNITALAMEDAKPRHAVRTRVNYNISHLSIVYRLKSIVLHAIYS